MILNYLWMKLIKTERLLKLIERSCTKKAPLLAPLLDMLIEFLVLVQLFMLLLRMLLQLDLYLVEEMIAHLIEIEIKNVLFVDVLFALDRLPQYQQTPLPMTLMMLI